MTTVLQKVRWIVFGVGLLLILVAGIGWATNAPWGNIFNSFSAIFGTMMSFAQMFISFPTTTIGLPKMERQPAQPQAAPAEQPQYPNYPPNYPTYPPPARKSSSPYHTPPPPPPPPVSLYPSYAPYPMPMSAPPPPKRYKWSGIALWIGAGCALLQIDSFLTLASGHASLQDVYDYYALIFLQGVCFLCALRGVHAKHARTAGALGVLAILAIGGALLLSVIASTIYLANANSNTFTIAPAFAQQVVVFTNIDNVFIVIGDLLLGISFIVGKVYPAWIGVMGIVLGCVVLLSVLVQFEGATPLVGLFILSATLSAVQNAATGWILFKKP